MRLRRNVEGRVERFTKKFGSQTVASVKEQLKRRKSKAKKSVVSQTVPK